ncbi:Cyclic beta-(1,2)-glucan synthase NdvB [Candidatus Methylobacter favarea]|uniref:Cyclic beta-(1,2)-glucan synthase NdvB n=1 Tax=Candidatus Methylobacter favarea TaxID=2707345 RepID=A0A8S0XDT5_9GAMM|nr:glucoamylase family protein [Candidatus Methylobacter favarea]CAA9889027.1 Cyclic beta-(1,2)-glucan synthase NdvB [Candidatus Methylobacter favarea]
MRTIAEYKHMLNLRDRRRYLRLEDPGGNDAPIRNELFSNERLAQHADSLAKAQNIGIGPKGRKLIPRVRENSRVLLEAYKAVGKASIEQRAITPAAEWLLDNFHVIEEQVNDINIQLPESYYRQLPKLAAGFLAGYPRVYGIAWALVAHTDSRFSPETLTLFIKAYQETQSLHIGELWAIPITLRIMLIENLRRLAIRIMRSQTGRRLADEYVDQLEKSESATLPVVLPSAPLRRAFVVQLVQRLHDPHPGLTPSLEFLNEWLADQNITVDEIVHQEHALQIAANLTMRNIITSMRAISAFDWPNFVEKVSLVDDCLRAHPIYSAMDFLSRDRYRHAIEELGKHSPHPELEIAQKVMDKIHRLPETTTDKRKQEPGYYLIGPGRTEFERELNCHPPFLQRLLRKYITHAALSYLSSLFIVTAVLLALIVDAASKAGLGELQIFILALLAIFPISDIAAALVNRIIIRVIPPAHIPRLELKEGIDSELRTFVVVPTLLMSEAGVKMQIDELEILYLSNPSGDVVFALLSDWADADQETTPEDAHLLSLATAGIAALNVKYNEQRFYLFHRKRLWNSSEEKWMGWERKRGKLQEFNRLLRGAENTSFITIDGKAAVAPAGVRYVITLDDDTKLPIGAVSELVGTAAHPLNHPVIDTVTRCVIEGYGILQPRVTATLPHRGERSIFHRLFSGACGMDAYSTTVSEVYQDLFGLGTYSGKGLYDVDAFETSLAGRVPENSQLSHDLFESTYARCGLVSDIEVFEEFPSDIEVAAYRSHRWARGDWQLLPWIFGPLGKGMPMIGRWKMLDNLRRSLSAPGAFFLLLAAWTMPNAPQIVLLGLVLTALAFPAILTLASGCASIYAGPLRSQLRALAENLGKSLGNSLVNLMLLAQNAWLMLDAIVTTLVRVFITRRKLLLWVTARQTKTAAEYSPKRVIQPLGRTTVLVVSVSLVIFLFNPAGLEIAWPILLLWWLAPVFSHILSLPPRPEREEALLPEQALQLRLIGRRTWRFFTTFVTPEEHYLPPDNYQEDPEPVIAHRSSPTNFGLYLLSVLAAHDFGWLGILDTVERLEATLSTLNGLPRLNGHFYNWYDTSDLRPLEPRYVSTVDSGNLAANLLVLAQGCGDIARQPLAISMAANGILDTHRILSHSFAKIADDRRIVTVSREELQKKLTKIETLLANSPGSHEEGLQFWRQLTSSAETLIDMVRAYNTERGDSSDSEVFIWASLLRDDIRSHQRDMEKLGPFIHNIVPLEQYTDSPQAYKWTEVTGRLQKISENARELFLNMNFGFLYDQDRFLFSLGYRVENGIPDDSYYDLLASEARLASLIAIAKREAPKAHWLHLGRRVTRAAGGTVLLSWSGSMFEYLMPSLISYTPRYSLLDETCRTVIKRQIEYGKECGVPWGVSESAFNGRDREFTYQYSPFGVPGLGMKRGLGHDLVIAPYATALAAMYNIPAAAENFQRLEAIGALGPFGYYEALDFTPSRLAENQHVAIVRCYMTHHQGMSLLALANVLHDGKMRHRFHNVPLIEAAELLLQERVPRGAESSIPDHTQAQAEAVQLVQPPVRRVHSPMASTPSAHLLSNGRYAVMITAAGSGYSMWKKLAVTRWREDVTRDSWGSYIYLRNLANGQVWSAGYQPTVTVPDKYEVVFLEDRARIFRVDGNLVSRLEIVVSPEDDAEIRRLSLTNNGARTQHIEITSYAEIVLAPPLSDIAHPAFSNLFVQTEFLPQAHGLIAHRRPRSTNDPHTWAAHILAGADADAGLQYETDRFRFVGRGQTLRAPVAVMDGRPLTNTVGAVLDPIFSLRTRVSIESGATVHVAFTTLIASSRQVVEDLIDKYHSPATFERVSALAWTHAQVQLRHLRIKPDEAQLFQALANRLLYADQSLRPSSKLMQLNRLNVTGLWRLSISGDRPLILLRVTGTEDRAIVDQLLRAHEYWRMKRLAVDIVILSEKGTTYADELINLLEGMVRDNQAVTAHHEHGEHGEIFVLRADMLSDDERLLLRTAARALLVSSRGTLAEQLLRLPIPAEIFIPAKPAYASGAETPAPKPPKLEYFNGLGGFAEDGREYVIVLDKGQWTPAPWINVIANAEFGFTVSELGSGCTWCLNSRENQLTPWSNDPVVDPPGEIFYLRDDNTGDLWSPTALPIRIENASYVIRHGHGYSRFEHASHGIHSELLQFVSPDDPVKISSLLLKNISGRTRKLTITAYIEWVLGASRTVTAPHIITELDSATGALFAANTWHPEFGERIAFADLAGTQTAWTGNRTEFIGRNGSLDSPTALRLSSELKNSVGAGLDPCAAMGASLQLAPDEQVEIVFLLGQGRNRDHARELVKRYRSTPVQTTIAAVKEQWRQVLTKVQVKTPDRALDLMINGWLLYQTLSCRMWARAAFYQAGGAFGFRDQLQDSMALAVAKPDVVRAHILRAAARQFAEGDVQHWWHPPANRGVRTHFSDDRIWLPYVISHYVKVTGDADILNEITPFLDGPLLTPEQEDAYFEPTVSTHQATVFEHCARALDLSLAVGAHGLPLIGSGDWNDGMNRVGHEGKGESVWLAWFLISALSEFATLAETQGYSDHAARWRDHAAKLKLAVEAEGWDAAWYRRAYFDDGTPLGSASNAECRIDSIAQSWGIISGAAEPERARRAMNSVKEYLIRYGDDLVLLFTPPFDKTPLDPGYIKGYLPGVRENGGQYTHAAIWCVIAYALLGEGDQAAELIRMLNPVNRTSSRTGVYAYKVEPYVIAADIYAVPPHVRRGGWTWYTGAAGWFYRAGLEWMLGLQIRAGHIYFNPCIPHEWRSYNLYYQHQDCSYEITVENPNGVSKGVVLIELDGTEQSQEAGIPLLQDNQIHQVRVVLG